MHDKHRCYIWRAHCPNRPETGLSESIKNLHKHAGFGWIWGSIEQFAQRGLVMVVSLVLARLLEPTAFGLIASVSIFMTISQQIIDGGISQRILQKTVLQEEDYTALFWCNGVVSLLLCILLCVAAYPISLFFQESRLTPITMALSGIIFLMNAGRVQETQLIRNLRFRAVALIRICSVIVGCVAGLTMAFLGFGVWALIGQQASMAGAKAISLWILVPWRPSGLPVWVAIKDLYRFGLPIAASQTMRSFAGQFINVMIARLYSPAMLGFYDRGKLIPQNLGYSIQNVFSRTNFPILAKLQNDPEAFRRTFVHFIYASAGINFMLMTALALAAREIVLVLLGEKWLPGVWFLQASAVVFAIYSLFMANADVLKALGRIRLFFKLNMLCAVLQLGGILIGALWGIKTMVIGDITGRFLACLFLVLAVASDGHIRLREQVVALRYPVLGAVVVAVVLLGIKAINLGLWSRSFLMGAATLILVALYLKIKPKQKHNIIFERNQ